MTGMTFMIIHSGRLISFDSRNHLTTLSLFRISVFLCWEVSVNMLWRSSLESSTTSICLSRS